MSERLLRIAHLDAFSPATIIEESLPEVTGRDLLIHIDAVAVNPVDSKIVAGINSELSTAKTVGYDACGTVIASGQQCELFQPGDRVFYAGDVSRQGCFASHQLVDERTVGLAPTSLTDTQAAAMPLTSITAWEALFSRLKISRETDQQKTLLIIGGAGGVGSIAIQLAKQLVGMQVVATASREASADWCRELGADEVIDHSQPLVQAYRDAGLSDPDYILCLNDSDLYFDAMAELIAPQGMLCIVVTTQRDHDLNKLKNKSAGLVWEFMFTRPLFNTADLSQQHLILNQIAALIDKQTLRCTMTQQIGQLDLASLKQAHEMLASGHTLGKIALVGMNTV
jgi:zinc-binding alcohol dehydrogenase family protein